MLVTDDAIRWPAQLAMLATDPMLRWWIRPETVKAFVDEEVARLPPDQFQWYADARWRGTRIRHVVVRFLRRHPGLRATQVIDALVDQRISRSRNAAAMALCRAHRAGELRREGTRNTYRYYANG